MTDADRSKVAAMAASFDLPPTLSPTLEPPPTGRPSAGPALEPPPTGRPSAGPALEPAPTGRPSAGPALEPPPTGRPSAGPALEVQPSAAPALQAPPPDLSDDDAEEALLAPNTPLQNGSFYILGVLGQGGFGVTYLARDMRLEREVAIKEFFPMECTRRNNKLVPSRNYPQDLIEKDRRAFLDEARVLAQFHHANIVQVFTFFEENGTAYMVMEYVKGRTLQEIVATEGPLPEQDAVAHVIKICEALDVVHAANLLHRDIKPANILITDTGRAVLLDFGIARHFVTDVAQTHSTFVTHGYAPLEQYVEKAKRSPATDLYALGGTLYFMLTAQKPPAAHDRQLGSVTMSPPSGSLPVRDAVMWAMALRAEDRPQSALELIAALQGAAAVPVTPTAPPPAAPSFAGSPFNFKNGAASSIAELAVLCGQYGDEARDYLFGGYFESWLVSVGEAALARRVRMLTEANAAHRDRAFELVMRELCSAGGLDAYPQPVFWPKEIEINALPMGGRATQVVEMKNVGRGLMWGKLAIDPPLPGASVTPTFNGNDVRFEVIVDASSAHPVGYVGNVTVHVEGVPRPHSLPLRCSIVPVRLEADPPAIDLGTLPHGVKQTCTVKLRCVPEGGRMQGNVSVDAKVGEIVAPQVVTGATCDLKLTVKTEALESGQTCERTVRIDSNVGVLEIPIRFQVQSRTSLRWAWTVGGAVACAALAGVARLLLAQASPLLTGWFHAMADVPALRGSLSLFGVAALGVTFVLLRLVEPPVRPRDGTPSSRDKGKRILWS